MREVPDTERGERVRACRSHGRRRRAEGRSGALPWRLPASFAEDRNRAERIARLREAVEAGTYAPDPYLVARAMLTAGIL
jgi:hypothetical protein